ncbi:FAD-dependent thymidylate synthase, partial [bacterium]|nr:FAD-dependent thymidylate synthase [bacterium]
MPLRVHLAGYNVDANALSEIREILNSILREAGSAEHWSDVELRRFIAELYRASEDSVSKQALTPEVLSAAYARISRDPKSIPELRRAAREGISRARKSNEMIIFGLGHASVSEHASFNFDVLDLSRLAAEELQSHRLLSFTEKSQRYITASDDFVLPEELKGTEWETRFPSEIKARFENYREFFRILLEKIITEEGEAPDKKTRTDQETRAKEDARYVLPLATTTQMGMSLNARNLEYVLRDCAGHELAEMRELGEKLCEVARSLAPSLIKYTEAHSFPRQNRSRIAKDYPVQARSESMQMLTTPQVSFISATEQGEQVVADAIAFHAGAQLEAKGLSPQFWREVFRGMTEHDAAPREFELATLQFQVKVSACCYGQLKRHRMATFLP